MKKMMLAVVVFAGVAALTSCKKDYSCECNGVGVVFSYDTTFTDVTKKDAESKCNDLDINFFGVGQECELE